MCTLTLYLTLALTLTLKPILTLNPTLTVTRTPTLARTPTRYVSGGGSSQADGSGASASASAAEADDCCICQEGLSDSKANDEYGEPLETGCGHRFHVVCLARHLEASTSSGQEPVCPMCRSSKMTVSFRPPTRPVG